MTSLLPLTSHIDRECEDSSQLLSGDGVCVVKCWSRPARRITGPDSWAQLVIVRPNTPSGADIGKLPASQRTLANT